MPSSPHLVRVLVAVALWVLAVMALVNLVGGPDPLGDAWGLMFGLAMLAIFGTELREHPGRAQRRGLRVGVAIGVLLVVGGVLDLVS